MLKQEREILRRNESEYVLKRVNSVMRARSNSYFYDDAVLSLRRRARGRRGGQGRKSEETLSWPAMVHVCPTSFDSTLRQTSDVVRKWDQCVLVSVWSAALAPCRSGANDWPTTPRAGACCRSHACSASWVSNNKPGIDGPFEVICESIRTQTFQAGLGIRQRRRIDCVRACS